MEEGTSSMTTLTLTNLLVSRRAMTSTIINHQQTVHTKKTNTTEVTKHPNQLETQGNNTPQKILKKLSQEVQLELKVCVKMTQTKCQFKDKMILSIETIIICPTQTT